MSDQSTESEALATGTTPYAMLGGDAGVRALVDRFYDLMDLEPEYTELRSVHAPTLDSAREKLYLYLSGWLGGPSLYMDRYGHPRLEHVIFRSRSARASAINGSHA